MAKAIFATHLRAEPTVASRLASTLAPRRRLHAKFPSQSLPVMLESCIRGACGTGFLMHVRGHSKEQEQEY